MHGKGYGMPSSHAQFVSFFATSLTLFLLVRHRPSTQHGMSHNNSNDALIYPTYKQSTFLERLVLSTLAICGAASVAASRIYLSYHTPKQVNVGIAAGAIFAVVWFVFTSLLRSSGWLEYGLDTSLARLVRLRDLITTEDLQDSGWARWVARRRMIKAKRL